VEFLTIFSMSSHPRTNAKPPIENLLATVLSLLHIHLLSTRSPILPKWNKNLNTYVAWSAQIFGWVKMFGF